MAVTMSLSEMVDLSLTTPEISRTNFNILHALLHVIINNLGLRQPIQVEFGGKDTTVFKKIKDGPKNPAQVSLKKTDKKDQVIYTVEPPAEIKDVKPPPIPGLGVEELNKLKEDVQELKELPGNFKLIQATLDKEQPILDMFRVLSVTKRVRAAEEGIEKLASLIEDLIRRQKELANQMDKVGQLDIFIDRLDKIERFLGFGEAPEGGEDNLVDMIYKDAMRYIQSELKGVTNSIKVLSTSVQENKDRLVEKVEKVEKSEKSKAHEHDADAEAAKQKDCCDKLQGIENMLNELMAKMARVDELVEKLDECAAVETEKDDQNNVMDEIFGLQDAIESLQNYIQDFLEFMKKYDSDKEDLFCQFQHILEAIDLLKITKADLEEVLELVREKVDITMLEDKERKWCDAIAELHQLLECKVEIDGYEAYKLEVEAKIRTIQQKLEALKCLKQLQEASGAKSKLLGCVDCFTCEKAVVMRRKAEVQPRPGLGARENANLAPYIAYEMDRMRMENPCTCPEKLKPCDDKPPKTPNYDCHRRTGGEHTLTTAQQRCTRESTFENIYGVSPPKMSHDKVLGIDKRCYAARRDSLLFERKEHKQPNAMQVFGNVVDCKTPRSVRSAKTTVTGKSKPEVGEIFDFNKNAVAMLTNID